jgi:hypothetical protein
MAYQYWNRYSDFLINGEQTVVPFVQLPQKTTDKSYIYKTARSRLDVVSQEYYNSPLYGWLIMLANPLAGNVEFEIPNNFFIRIPFPLIVSLQDYKSGVELYKLYYGEQ